MKYYFIIFFIFFTNLFSEYKKSPFIAPETWETLKPYFLPEDKPIKAKLDKIFSKRVSGSVATLDMAGFKILSIKKRPGQPIVVKHPKLKGYVLKLFTDDLSVENEWKDLEQRIIGAQIIQETISKFGYQHYFKVPQKWIYPLPASPEPRQGLTGKHFVLVAEDMKILSRKKNKKWWRSIVMTKELMQAIYNVYSDAGLYDCIYIENAPFCKDRKIAFIDTQHFHGGPINFKRMKKYFPVQLQQYWLELIEDNH